MNSTQLIAFAQERLAANDVKASHHALVELMLSGTESNYDQRAVAVNQAANLMRARVLHQWAAWPRDTRTLDRLPA